MNITVIENLNFHILEMFENYLDCVTPWLKWIKFLSTVLKNQKIENNWFPNISLIIILIFETVEHKKYFAN